MWQSGHCKGPWAWTAESGFLKLSPLTWRINSQGALPSVPPNCLKWSSISPYLHLSCCSRASPPTRTSLHGGSARRLQGTGGRGLVSHLQSLAATPLKSPSEQWGQSRDSGLIRGPHQSSRGTPGGHCASCGKPRPRRSTPFRLAVTQKACKINTVVTVSYLTFVASQHELLVSPAEENYTYFYLKAKQLFSSFCGRKEMRNIWISQWECVRGEGRGSMFFIWFLNVIPLLDLI